jgi:hypothetical protein
MSLKVWGALILKNDKVSSQEKITLAFEIMKIATDNRIFIRLGYHVESSIFKLYKELENLTTSIPFQISANPLVSNVEALFAGSKALGIYSGTEKEDWGETFDSRITRLSIFFIDLLNNNNIKYLILFVNPGYDELIDVSIKVHNFKERIMEIYKNNDDYTPNIKLIINK